MADGFRQPWRDLEFDVVVRMDVDEARRDPAAVRGNFLPRGSGQRRADRRNAPVSDRDIGGHRWRAAAVEH